MIFPPQIEQKILKARRAGISVAAIAKENHTGRDKVVDVCHANMTPEEFRMCSSLCYSLAASRDRPSKCTAKVHGYTLSNELNQCAAKWLHDWKPA